MFWKIYFWVLLLLYGILLIASIWIHEEIKFEVVDFIDFCFAIFALVGVFGYAFNKAVLNQIVWKVYLPFIIVWDLCYTVLCEEWVGGEELIFEVIALILMVLILVPQYVAIYRYGYHSR